MSGTVAGIDEILKDIEEIAKRLEEQLNDKVIYMIFHGLDSITRDVVDDLEFFILTRHGGRVDKDLYVVLHTMGGDPMQHTISV